MEQHDEASLVKALKHELEERKKTEEALRSSELRLRSYFEASLVGISVTSPDKGWIDVNATFCEMLGYSAEELRRMTWAEITHPDDMERSTIEFSRVVRGERDGYVIEKRYLHKSGRVVEAILSTKAVRRPDGSIEYMVSFLQDITARKQAERELRAHLETIQRQEEAIRTLSSPILQIWEGVLAVPLVGALDQGRAAELMGRLLERISSAGARYVIVDLTGADVVDTGSAAHLQRILAAAQLLGATTLVTGIRPPVAQTMIASGVDLSSVTTRSTLQDGLHFCLLKGGAGTAAARKESGRLAWALAVASARRGRRATVVLILWWPSGLPVRFSLRTGSRSSSGKTSRHQLTC